MKWREVPGYEGLYAVSDTGNVWNEGKGRCVRVNYNSDGYEMVTLYRRGQPGLRVSVHRLVASAFVPGQTETRNTVRHLDGQKLNNTPDNLMWGTMSENIRDSVDHGTHRNTRKTSCYRGHEFTLENTYHRINRSGRECRECRRSARRKN